MNTYIGILLGAHYIYNIRRIMVKITSVMISIFSVFHKVVVCILKILEFVLQAPHVSAVICEGTKPELKTLT
jgi:hypothetical protein